MKIILIFFLFLFTDTIYGDDGHKTIYLREGGINTPAKWNVNKENDCLFVGKPHINKDDRLKICRYISSEESNYFTTNESGEWEAITDGIPVLADVNTTPKFTGMNAIVSCKYKDDAGYHTGLCFQAEIHLPRNIVFIFTGRGDLSLFEDYKKVYFSFKIK
ncbi:hypothetical protein LSB85_001326 [Salmonella enterica]|nr:hypothetical protein [Salmonella enterica]